MRPLTELERGLPAAVRAGGPGALGHPALAADDAAEADELGRELRVALDEVVVGGLEVADHALPPRGEPVGEVAVGGGPQRGFEPPEDLLLIARKLPAVGPRP